jgi:phenol/toluene 2-monooxygenase (NADH) P0/A0
MNMMDTNKRWVNVTRKTENGFVEFEFFVANADLCIELILPEAAFKEFCLNNHIAVEESVSSVSNTSDAKVQHGGLLKLVK